MIEITTLLVEFHKHLVDNVGQPIGLPTVTAFAQMFKGIIDVLMGEEMPT